MPRDAPPVADQRLLMARRLRADAEARCRALERELAAALARERELIERLDAIEDDADTFLEPPP